MEIKNPYPESGTEKKKQKSAPPVGKAKEKDNAYLSLTDDDEPEEEEEDEDDPEKLDDPEEEGYEDPTWYKTPAGMIGIVIAVVALAVIAYFVFKSDPLPLAEPTEQEAVVDPTSALKGDLYKMGIGKDRIDEKNIYEQGSIESGDFRKDFVNTDSPENYALPINIVAVNDSVSYTKHRTMTDDGMDMYWADAVYKSKKTRFTVPYYIWQTLAPQGVMDVVAEVVTDADGRTFVTSITAVPPTSKD